MIAIRAGRGRTSAPARSIESIAGSCPFLAVVWPKRGQRSAAQERDLGGEPLQDVAADSLSVEELHPAVRVRLCPPSFAAESEGGLIFVTGNPNDAHADGRGVRLDARVRRCRIDRGTTVSIGTAGATLRHETATLRSANRRDRPRPPTVSISGPLSRARRDR